MLRFLGLWAVLDSAGAEIHDQTKSTSTRWSNTATPLSSLIEHRNLQNSYEEQPTNTYYQEYSIGESLASRWDLSICYIMGKLQDLPRFLLCKVFILR